jgi:hypothetical protein
VLSTEQHPAPADVDVGVVVGVLGLDRHVADRGDRVGERREGVAGTDAGSAAGPARQRRERGVDLGGGEES